jgi:L-ribulose-5-phosphate 3-epimerase
MNHGFRAHDFGKLPVEELAKKISEKGFKCIQLALAKAISNIDAGPGKLNPGLANYIRETFNNHGILIAVLGCYINPIHPDKDERKKQLSRFKEHIRFARDFGCSIVATETGSINADCSFHSENKNDKTFQMLFESVSELVNESEKFGIITCIEGVTKHVISTPQKMKRMIDLVKSNNLQVLFDPTNLTSMENHENHEEMIKESFDLFGDKIQIIHAKDFIIEKNEIKSVPAGKGNLNYKFLFKIVKEKKPFISILLEDNKPDAIDSSIDYVKKIFEEV